MSNVIVDGVRTYNGINVPLDAIRVVDSPDPRRPHGYHRILHTVETYSPRWVEFDFGNRHLAQRVAQRLRRHVFGSRYEIIWAHDLVFIKSKNSDVRAYIEGTV
jgi:hypothetical protein